MVYAIFVHVYQLVFVYGHSATSGRAAEADAAMKAAKYADPAQHRGDWRLHQQASPPIPGHPTGPRGPLPDPGTPGDRHPVALRGGDPSCGGD
jgi:hypothetical protein